MSRKKKQLVMKPGYYLKDGNIVECHFREIEFCEYSWGSEKKFLVLVEDVFKIESGYNDILYEDYAEAVEKSRRKIETTRRMYQKQLDYYTDKLEEL